MSNNNNCCVACGIDGATLRRCTLERLCGECRRTPEYKILTRPQVLAAADVIPEEIEDIRAGFIPNPVDKRLSKVAVYYWKDVMLRLVELNRELPDDEDWNLAWKSKKT